MLIKYAEVNDRKKHAEIGKVDAQEKLADVKAQIDAKLNAQKKLLR
jgi:hypothetical protein